jgi:hypothetical protein
MAEDALRSRMIPLAFHQGRASMQENERDEDRRIINGGGIDMSYICSPSGEVYPSPTYQLGMQQPPLHCVRQVFISIISKMSRSNQSP